MRYFDSDLPHFRGNLHLHTIESDGKWSAEKAIREYAAQGYDFLAVTDHWKRYRGIDQFQNMRVFSGVELDSMPDRYQTAHIVGFGLNDSFDGKTVRGLSAQEQIDVIRQCGGHAILAHPAWSLNTHEFIASLHGLTGTEIFNSLSRTPWNGDRADSSGILDVVSARSTLLPFVASDDSHFYTGEQFGAWTVVQCEKPEADCVADAIAKGLCYASTGPDFTRIEYADGQLMIECTPVSKITVYSNQFWISGRCMSGEKLTSRVYPIKAGQETFVRCQITDENGRNAWTSPIPVK